MVFTLSVLAQTPTQSISVYKHAVPSELLKQYPVVPYNFIDLIKAIPKPLPASLGKFQKIFNNHLSISERGSSSITYKINAFRTLDGVIIKRSGITTDIKTNKVTWFGMSLDQSQCVNLQLLKKEFGFLVPKLLELPLTSTSLIGLYTTDEWGLFSLSTTMNGLDCANGIGIAIFSDKQEKKEWIKYVRKNAPHLRERDRQRELEEK